MKTVLTFGVFDLFHSGHLNLLERAKELGDYLIVGVPTSWTIEEHIKGHPTTISFEDRLRIVNALKCVDFAFGYADSESLRKSILLLKPSVVCRADDNKEFVGKEEAEQVGAEIVYFPYTKGISSSKLRGESCE